MTTQTAAEIPPDAAGFVNWLSACGTRRDAIAHATAQGWRKLGGGHFSAAYRLSSKYVLKVQHECHGEPDGGLPYARLCLRNPDQRAMVRVYAVREWSDGGYAVIMERLEGFDEMNRKSPLWAQWQAARAYLRGDEAAPAGLTKALRRACNRIRHWHTREDTRYGRWSVDLHAANVMVRGAELVITDPLAFKA